MVKKCPKCGNKFYSAGIIEELGELFYCKVCKYRQMKYLNSEKIRHRTN